MCVLNKQVKIIILCLEYHLTFHSIINLNVCFKILFFFENTKNSLSVLSSAMMMVWFGFAR